MCKQFCDNVNTMCFARNIPTAVQRKIFKSYFLNTLLIKTCKSPKNPAIWYTSLSFSNLPAETEDFLETHKMVLKSLLNKL